MVGFNHDEGREDEETSPRHGNLDFDDVGGQDHHDDEGDAGTQDHHDDEADIGRHGQGVDSGGENVDTQTSLITALQDPHVQELLLKETSNEKPAGREKAKLAQMKIDGKTPLYPGCRP